MSDAVLGLWDESVPRCARRGHRSVDAHRPARGRAPVAVRGCGDRARGGAASRVMPRRPLSSPRCRHRPGSRSSSLSRSSVYRRVNSPACRWSTRHGGASDGGGREDVLTFGAPGQRQARAAPADLSSEPQCHADRPAALRRARPTSGGGGRFRRTQRPARPHAHAIRFVRDRRYRADGERPDHGAERRRKRRRRAAASGSSTTTPALTITGLACGGAEAWPRKGLSCLLDRLDLASGGDDRQVIDFFASTELKRDAACGGMRLGPDTVHAPWLDDKPATRRKSLRHH